MNDELRRTRKETVVAQIKLLVTDDVEQKINFTDVFAAIRGHTILEIFSVPREMCLTLSRFLQRRNRAY